MKDKTFTAAELIAAGLKLYYLDDEMYLIEGGVLKRHFIGHYDAPTLDEISKDMRAIREAIDAGKLGGRRKRTHVEIDTTEYYRAHGEEPRGRGNWVFRIGSQTLGHTGAYANAAVAARARAVELGVTRITVVSA
jgi:hypothetical protein